MFVSIYKKVMALPLLFILLLTLGVIVGALLSIVPYHKMYQINAETGFLKLHLSDSIQNRWDISEFEICQPNDNDFLFDDEQSPFNCLPPQINQDELIINVNANTFASFNWSMSQGLQIELSAIKSVGSLDIPSGEIELLGEKVLLHRKINNSSSLIFTFEGEAQVGTEAKLGNNNLLRNGQIQVYEKAKWKWIGKRYLLGELNLEMGDTISLIQPNDNNAMSVVKGVLRISPEETGYEKGLYVVAYTAASTDLIDNDSLQITRFGTEGYSFSPTAWNRIQSDPVTNIFITLFGALYLWMEIISKWKEREEKNEKDQRNQRNLIKKGYKERNGNTK